MEVALAHHRAGDLARAEAIYRQVLAQDPNHTDALHLLGAVAHQVGRNEDAVELISRAIRLRPTVPEYHTNLGEALVAMGRVAEGMASYRTAIRVQPRFMQPYNNLAVVLLWQNKPGEAEKVLREALGVEPDNASVLGNLGIMLSRQGKYDHAKRTFERVVELEPQNVEGYDNLGVVLLSMNQLEGAVKAFRRALELRPGVASALNNLGTALQLEGFAREAVACFREAVERAPEFAGAHSNLLLALHYVPGIGRKEMFEEHLAWARTHAGGRPLPQPSPGVPGEGVSEKRLRVGLVSADFRQHSVAYFLEPVLEEREGNKLEVICYSDVQEPDAVTHRIEKLSDRWRDWRGVSNDRAAEMVRADGIDVLVDLAGHTGMNRLTMFAGRAAPLQVSWLGYPDTTGIAAMDYRVTDVWADPMGDGDVFHTEKLIRLQRCAWCYRPAKSSPAVGPLAASRNGYVTFGSFNMLAKINEELLALWARILRQAPRSRLLLKAQGLEDRAARYRIIDTMAKNGIDESRIELRDRAPSLDEHFKTYHAVDVALDSFPYHGTTTTCDALWMGVPVVALRGDRHVSRVGVSLLSSVGLEELIARDADEYVQMARELARDVKRMTELRRVLRERMRRSPLLDGKEMARTLEGVFRCLVGSAS